jgi:hypothetical protein
MPNHIRRVQEYVLKISSHLMHSLQSYRAFCYRRFFKIPDIIHHAPEDGATGHDERSQISMKYSKLAEGAHVAGQKINLVWGPNFTRARS